MQKILVGAILAGCLFLECGCAQNQKCYLGARDPVLDPYPTEQEIDAEKRVENSIGLPIITCKLYK